MHQNDNAEPMVLKERTDCDKLWQEPLTPPLLSSQECLEISET